MSTITEEAKLGRLPGRRVGKGWRFSRRVLEQWLASGPDAEDINRYRWKSKTEPRSDGKKDESS